MTALETLQRPPTVAALYIDPRGPYPKMPGVDCWDIERDARKYDGPHPVVAHPPCERWGRWAGERLGDDGGCFAAALHCVRVFGGVLEHPEASGAWRYHAMTPPPRSGGWVKADLWGWTCCVEQGHYGHRARKATWLYAAGFSLPDLIWGRSVAKIGPRPGRDPIRERRIGAVQRMCRAERRRTPQPFADLLVSLARSVDLAARKAA